MPYLKRKQRILDLGCGNGRLRDSLPIEIIPDGYYYGLDKSNELLKIARENHPSDHFYHKDFSQKMPFGDENFDIITGIASFHHLTSRADQNKLLQECRRTLSSSGIIFFTTWKLPMKWWFSNFINFRWKNWLIPFGKEKFPRIYRRINPSEMKKILTKNGFKVLHCAYFENRNLVSIAQKI